MLTARPPASPSDGEPSEIRRVAPLTLFQRYESTDLQTTTGVPAVPIDPARPIDAASPIDPARPIDAARPTAAGGPIDASGPTAAARPTAVARGENHVTGDGPAGSAGSAGPSGSTGSGPGETTRRLSSAETTQRLTVPTTKGSGTKGSGTKGSSAKGSSAKASTAERSTVELPALAPPTVELPAVASPTVELPTIDPQATAPSGPEASNLESSTVELATANPATTKPATAKPATAKPATGTPAAAESVTVDLAPVRARLAPTTSRPVTVPVIAPPARPATRPGTPTTTRPAPAVRPEARPAGGRFAGWGHASAVLALSSVGVLIVAFAYAGGRSGTSGAIVFYWVGQVVVFAPVAARLLWRRTLAGTESFLLVMGLAVNQYMLKWMYSPDEFRFPDELQHWLATTILIDSGRLFQPNPALPPAVHFPGLAEMGAAVSSLTGLPVTAAGMLVAGVAHLLFVAALYAVVWRATRSAAVAGVTCMVYATTLHYLFFNSMYLYATGALPFLMTAVWATWRWRNGGGTPFVVLATVCAFAATATHHVTAFMLVMTLTLLAVTELVASGRSRRWSALVMPAVAGAILACWIAVVAPDVVDYLEAPARQVADTVSVLLDGGPLVGSASTADVSLMQLGVQGAGLLVLFALYLVAGRDVLRRRYRDPWRWAALVGGGIFFAGNGVRFIGQNGPEIAGRLSTFTYVPISIVAAMTLVQTARLLPRRRADSAGSTTASATGPAGGRWPWSRIVAGTLAGTLLMVGARVGGWPPAWELLPGPYLVAGYERSVDAAGVSAAQWQYRVLGPGNRVGGDVSAVALSSTYGRQDPVRETADLFDADDWTLREAELTRSLGLDYLVVDRRLGTQLPVLRAYFEGDPRAGQRTRPMTAQQLSKFDAIARTDRLYDNGDIRIYRMGDNQ